MSAPAAVAPGVARVYNKARFDSWFEIGIKYQLNVFPFVTSKRLPAAEHLQLSLRPVGAVLPVPVRLGAVRHRRARFSHGRPCPLGIHARATGGLFVTSPWTWLVFVALFFAGAASSAGGGHLTDWSGWRTGDGGRRCGVSPASRR